MPRLAPCAHARSWYAPRVSERTRDLVGIVGGAVVVALGVAIPIGIHTVSPETSLWPLMGFGAIVVVRGTMLVISSARGTPGKR